MSERADAGDLTPDRKTSELAAPHSLHRALRAHRTISASNRALLRATDEFQLLHEMCALAVEQGGYVHAGVVYAGPEPSRTLRWMEWVGLENGKAITLDVRELNEAGYTWDDSVLGQDATGVAIRTKMPFTRQNVAFGPVFDNPQYDVLRRRAERAKYKSLTAFPLEDDRDVFGALFMAAPEPDAFDRQEIELLSELAADLSYGIRALRTKHAHQKAQETIARLTFFDQSTGLPNRAGLHRLLRLEVDAARASHEPVALLQIEIRRFQDIYNALGFTACDAVMQALAERLARTIPSGAVATIPADGNFAIVVRRGNVDRAFAIAGAVLDAFAAPADASGALIDAHIAVGIAVFPGHAADAESLERRARAAMHLAKTAPEGIAVYCADQEQQSAGRLAIMSELRRATDSDEFELYCQPKVEMGTRSPCGAEALIRWRHPTRGLVGPGSFIPLAEQGGLISSITGWLLAAAFQQAYAWQEAGEPHSLSINLSAHDLHDPKLVRRVRNLHSTWGIPEGLIQFELTESALMEDPESAKETLTQLKNLGFEVWIDDFGTGYSSLSYLHRFPVDAIKIDQSFVRAMTANTDSNMIVQATIDLGHKLGLHVIAEGVEDRAVWANLAAKGCDLAQGYFVAMPMPVDQYMQWDSEWRCKTW